MPTHRSTRQRRIVQDYFKSVDAFATIRQVHENVIQTTGMQSVGLSTVYRTVRLLLAAGQLDVAVGKSGAKLYRQCSVQVRHCHLVCRRCGHVVEVEPPETANPMTSRRGFTDVTCHVELTGLCPSCPGEAQPNDSD